MRTTKKSMLKVCFCKNPNIFVVVVCFVFSCNSYYLLYSRHLSISHSLSYLITLGGKLDDFNLCSEFVISFQDFWGRFLDILLTCQAIGGLAS